jgi:hypothetical protein
VWGERASPVSFAGPKRFAPVPVPIGSLPPLDAVIVSHDHYDHLDQPSIVALAKLDVPFYTSLGVGAHLQSWGVPAERITELDWWESAQLLRGDLSITAAPSQHFSGRGLGGRNGTLWSSFVVKGPRHAVFFSGDTGLTQEYAEIRTRLGPFDLVMLEVGAFHPAWGDIHLGPENALEALTLLGGAAFCRCTGAPSIWRCTPGTSRPRPWCAWRPRVGFTWSCPRWASRWNRFARKSSIPGGGRSLPRSRQRRSRQRSRRCRPRWAGRSIELQPEQIASGVGELCSREPIAGGAGPS